MQEKAQVQGTILKAKFDACDEMGGVVGLLLQIKLNEQIKIHCEGGYDWTHENKIGVEDLVKLLDKKMTCTLNIFSLSGGSRLAQEKKKFFHQKFYDQTTVRGPILFVLQDDNNQSSLLIDCGFPVLLEPSSLGSTHVGDFVEDLGILRFSNFTLDESW